MIIPREKYLICTTSYITIYNIIIRGYARDRPFNLRRLRTTLTWNDVTHTKRRMIWMNECSICVDMSCRSPPKQHLTPHHYPLSDFLFRMSTMFQLSGIVFQFPWKLKQSPRVPASQKNRLFQQSQTDDPRRLRLLFRSILHSNRIYSKQQPHVSHSGSDNFCTLKITTCNPK